MKYFSNQFDEAKWKYISDTHIKVKTELLLDIPPSDEFRIHITRYPSGASAEPHSHEWEHADYVLKGRGKAMVEGTEENIKEGTFIYVPRYGVHAVYNTGKEELVLFGVSGPPRTKEGYDQLKK
jgi:mannose-6-phosphate isomerase-like protein (cupin superfamily)